MTTQEQNNRYEDIENPDRPQKPATETGVSDFIELARALLVAAAIALCIRTFVFEPFNIPSESMYPTLKVGDYLFVEKYAYGYSRYSFPLGLGGFEGRIMASAPARGDVVVFRLPSDTNIDYIKRIVGLPGDTVQVEDGILHINGTAVRRDYETTEQLSHGNFFAIYHKYTETLPDGVKHGIYEISDEQSLDNTPAFTVPAGHYFVMGDNRDSSQDSRVTGLVGFVPEENLVGRAFFLFFSTEGIGDKCVRDGVLAAVRSVGCKVVEWPKAIRYNRIFRRVHAL